MRARGIKAAHLILLVLATALVLLVANVALFAGLYAKWAEGASVDAQAIMGNLTASPDGYRLSDGMSEALAQEGLFAMLISQDGHVVWQERLPEGLARDYTLQDVALFTRYYLDDYPVHTYIVDEGLLVVGGQRNTTWKYTLEYGEGMVRQMPLILLVDAALLVTIPLLIQRRWLRGREGERTEWIAGVSHDIRTPLTLILGNADYISQNPGDPAVAERADAIREQGLRIRALVANLNTSSKLDFGMRDYEKAPVRVSGLLRKIMADYLNQGLDDRYDLSLDMPDNLQDATVCANEELFRRLLENLVNNSIRHNPDGCEVCVALGADTSKAGGLILLVSDDGQGASEETLRALNRKTSLKSEGLGEHGIGLRVVRQIVEYHSWGVSFSRNDPRGFVTRISM